MLQFEHKCICDRISKEVFVLKNKYCHSKYCKFSKTFVKCCLLIVQNSNRKAANPQVRTGRQVRDANVLMMSDSGLLLRLPQMQKGKDFVEEFVEEKEICGRKRLPQMQKDGELMNVREVFYDAETLFTHKAKPNCGLV